ncbi:MAG: CRISPR-associated endonuclease Cas2, partial [Candidatus Aminicenantales bacterium]
MKEAYFWIVSYDIKDNRRRNHVSRELKNYGTRVQYSVFECLMPDEKARELTEKLESIIEDKEDSVRFYKICESCHRKISVYGRGK